MWIYWASPLTALGESCDRVCVLYIAGGERTTAEYTSLAFELGANLIWMIKVIRLRYSLWYGRFVPNCPKYFTSRLRDERARCASAEIKRVGANVKAQFPADGYELMEDARGIAFPVSPSVQMPRFVFLPQAE